MEQYASEKNLGRSQTAERIRGSLDRRPASLALGRLTFLKQSLEFLALNDHLPEVRGRIPMVSIDAIKDPFIYTFNFIPMELIIDLVPKINELDTLIICGLHRQEGIAWLDVEIPILIEDIPTGGACIQIGELLRETVDAQTVIRIDSF